MTPTRIPLPRPPYSRLLGDRAVGTWPDAIALALARARATGVRQRVYWHRIPWPAWSEASEPLVRTCPHLVVGDVR